ncbi:efflux RND transporter periplasmic adaptor subunit [Sediminibacterium sp.]|uniref:efflux RND transporter periplasmic adaptor subunit n=1 Tax=Sediminibacterium sp. TaxID=1917865 RepID=UPI0027362DFB|nr:efflux RND transporter periplasmic adaptor subunit [Sediminibacterium sp.]MDP3392373.1 efflux RND transporter periplasmic adaptor subunit [Sediminibacterium sp.]MDP3566825.1 efflux RND transporter periplasmic adaptor subunit [Sediminibacterium sp.]
MSKKLIWIIVGLVVIIGVIIGLKKAGIIGKEEGIKVTAEAVQRRTIIETVNASGKVYPEIEVKISPDVSGEIVELTVAEGDTVKRGQVLARIYADILNSQRDQVAAGVSQQQAQVSNTTAQSAAIKATLDQAETQYNRQKKLLDEKVISRLEFEQAEQAVKSARANYNAAMEGIKSAKAGVQSVQAQLNRANKDIGRTLITSPMDGVISLLAIKKGERVAGNSFNVGTEMMRVADMRSFEVRVDVGENDIPKVKLGDTAIVEVDAYTSRKFKGIVYKIANPSTGNNLTANASAEVTNYKVHIRLLQESYKDLVVPGRSFPFRPGMTASADIQTKSKYNVLSVPLNAVTTRDSKEDQKEKKDEKKPAAKVAQVEKAEQKSVSSDDSIEEVVFILQADSKVKKVKVKTAIQDLNNIEITEGVKEGDKVITGPYSIVSKMLKDGNLVTVVEKDKLFEEKKKD